MGINKTIRIMLDARLEGRKLSIQEEDETRGDEPAVEGEDDGAVAEAGMLLQPTDTSGAVAAAPPASEVPEQSIADDEDPSEDIVHSPEQDHEVIAVPDESSSAPVVSPGNAVPTDLKSLRGRAWTLAARLAQRNGMGELVEPIPGKGLGFVLRDVPDPTLPDQLDEQSLSQLTTLWWQLAACSEITFAPLESILPLLPEESILRRALETEDADLLFSSIWTLDPGYTGYRLWQAIDDRDWQDLLSLMDAYRRIRRAAADTGVSIWE